MNLLQIPVELIKRLNLYQTSDEHLMLEKDISKYHDSIMKKDNPNKLEELYRKIHANPLARVASPFIFIFTMNWAKKMLNPESDRGNYLQDDLD